MAGGGYLCCIFLGPLKIFSTGYNHLQLIRFLMDISHRRGIFFRREAYPVPSAGKRMSPARLQVGGDLPILQLTGHIIQVYHQGFSTGYHHRCRRKLGSTFHDSVDLNGRMKFGIPRILGIAPAASYIATPDPDKIGRLPCMEALSLYGVELLYQWYFSSLFKKVSLCHVL